MEMIRELILEYYQSILVTIFFFILITYFLSKRWKKDDAGGNIGTADGSSVCDSPYLDCSGGGGDGGA